MATDYRHRSRKRKKRKPIPGWVWMVTGLLLGLFIAFLGYLQSQKVDVTTTTTEASDKTDAQVIAKPEPKRPRFDFYTILPEMEVIVPDEEVNARARQIAPVRKATPENAPSAITSKDTYFLQVGSFKNSKDADALRAKLALSGHTTKIQTVKINQDTWHRVRVGPFRSYTDLKDSRRKLEAAGINAIPLKVK